MIKINLHEYLNIESPDEGVINLIDDEYHDNFGYQWNRFNKLQLDSHNGSSESEDRLINQSEFSREDFNGKVVLEVGAGNGRFTEILLNLGAKVIAVDFSSAIYANYKNHERSVKEGNLLCLRGSLFDLPLEKLSFDIVLCYGVIQHTGNNELALDTLSSFVSEEGHLLIDIYSNSLKHYNPWVYLIRPIFSKLITNNEKRMEIVEKFVNFVFSFQVKLLTYLRNKKGILRYLRYFVNRSPNSVYGINLYLEGKVSFEHAKDWSICDTNDAWTPQHDDPVSFAQWKKLISGIKNKYNFSTEVIKDCGQGSCAVLKKENRGV
jgi:2-polyprenyl-3-methyl-5-hydroxy-6-metoxy-1,4-benzoquinol methylase